MPQLQRLKYQYALNTLGIQTWSLNRPNIFNGEVAVQLLPETKLVVLSEHNSLFENKLIADILKSMGLTHLNLMIFSASKIPLLNQAIASHLYPLFFLHLPLNLKNDENDENDEGEVEQKNTLSILNTRKEDRVLEVNYEQLRTSASMKRQLWQGISEYVNHQQA